MGEKKLLNDREVEGTFGLTVAWQRKARLHRTGPPFLKIGRLVRYRMSDIEQYLSEHVVPTCQGRQARPEAAGQISASRLNAPKGAASSWPEPETTARPEADQ